MLGVQVWLEVDRKDGGCRVRHIFYEKSMASPLVFRSRFSYNWKVKIVIFGEEVKKADERTGITRTE